MIELTNKQILNIWQSATSADNVNLSYEISKYLYTGKLSIKDNKARQIKSIYKINNFEDFVNYIITQLTKIIESNSTTENMVVFRGERRDKFNFSIGDEIDYKNIHSTYENIKAAYKYVSTECKNNVLDKYKLIFVINLPKTSHYQRLNKMFKFADTENSDISYYNVETELILLPTKYTIIHIEKIYNNIKIIHIKPTSKEGSELINKEIINNTELTELKSILLKQELCDKQLLKYEKYSINENVFDIISNVYNEGLFTKDKNINEIKKITKDISTFTYVKVFQELSKFHIGYNDYRLFNKETLIKKFKDFSNFDFNSIKMINKITLYAGYENYNDKTEIPPFIKLISQIKEGEYDKIISNHISYDDFLYNTTSSFEEKDLVEKDDKLVKQYYKYICKFNCSNVKICRSRIMDKEWRKDIVLIPSISYKIIDVSEAKNKFGQTVYIFNIDVSGKY